MNLSEKSNAVKHLLQVIELETDQIDYVTTERRIKTPTQLRKWSNKDINNAVGEGKKINDNEATQIINMIKWCKEYYNQGGEDIDLINDFTDKVWESCDPDEDSGQETTSTMTYENKTSIKISLSDYKNFDGSYKEWAVMKRQFTVTANAHGFGAYVDKEYEIPTELHSSYKKYVKASNHVYNAFLIS